MLKCVYTMLLVILILAFVVILMKILPLNLPVRFFSFGSKYVENYDTHMVDFERFLNCCGCV